MVLGTYHFTWGPKYDMDAHMATLSGREAWDILKVGSNKKLDPTLNTSPANILCIN